MSNTELPARVDDMEMRHTHLEAALEEMTRALLAQEQRLREQTERLQHLEQQVLVLQGGAGSAPTDERPPHY